MRNRELSSLLIRAGETFGFVSIPEFCLPGGRIDVVWAWHPPSPLPGLATPVPVLGIEIESSRRTRKHVTGDLLNLRDAGVALGVIVLVAHWHGYRASAVARAIIDAGWHASTVDFNTGEVSLVPGPPPRANPATDRKDDTRPVV